MSGPSGDKRDHRFIQAPLPKEGTPEHDRLQEYYFNRSHVAHGTAQAVHAAMRKGEWMKAFVAEFGEVAALSGVDPSQLVPRMEYNIRAVGASVKYAFIALSIRSMTLDSALARAFGRGVHVHMPWERGRASGVGTEEPINLQLHREGLLNFFFTVPPGSAGMVSPAVVKECPLLKPLQHDLIFSAEELADPNTTFLSEHRVGPNEIAEKISAAFDLMLESKNLSRTSAERLRSAPLIERLSIWKSVALRSLPSLVQLDMILSRDALGIAEAEPAAYQLWSRAQEDLTLKHWSVRRSILRALIREARPLFEVYGVDQQDRGAGVAFLSQVSSQDIVKAREGTFTASGTRVLPPRSEAQVAFAEFRLKLLQELGADYVRNKDGYFS